MKTLMELIDDYAKARQTNQGGIFHPATQAARDLVVKEINKRDRELDRLQMAETNRMWEGQK